MFMTSTQIYAKVVDASKDKATEAIQLDMQVKPKDSQTG